jgi:hypothetical protein
MKERPGFEIIFRALMGSSFQLKRDHQISVARIAVLQKIQEPKEEIEDPEADKEKLLTLGDMDSLMPEKPTRGDASANEDKGTDGDSGDGEEPGDQARQF